MTRERFENVRKMIESTDKENRTLGLVILEEQDFQENVAFILLAKKYFQGGNDEWEENAPKMLKRMKAINCLDVDRVFTFKTILKALREVNAPYPQIQFYLSTFGAYLLEQLQGLGYDFIDELDINIKIKTNE